MTGRLEIGLGPRPVESAPAVSIAPVKRGLIRGKSAALAAYAKRLKAFGNAL
jgi:hypothetical protein